MKYGFFVLLMVGVIVLIAIAAKTTLRSIKLYRTGNRSAALIRLSILFAGFGALVAAGEKIALFVLLAVVPAYLVFQLIKRALGREVRGITENPRATVMDGTEDGNMRLVAGSQGLGWYINGWRVDNTFDDDD